MLKLILKIVFGIILFCIISFIVCAILVIRVMDYLGIESDYCIEDGDCEEGRVIHTEKYGDVKINKENCLKYNWEWYEDGKWCNLHD